MPYDPNAPPPTLQDSLIGLSFQFGSGGGAGTGGGLPKPSGGDSEETQRLLDEVMGRQEELSTDYSSLNKQFGNFQTGFNDLNTKYDSLNKGFGGLTTNFDSLNKQLKTIFGF